MWLELFGGLFYCQNPTYVRGTCVKKRENLTKHICSLGVGDWGWDTCLLSSFPLFKTRYVRYLMAFWCMFFMRVLIFDFGMLGWCIS